VISRILAKLSGSNGILDPPDSVPETVDYSIQLSEVKLLELEIVPDKSGGEVRASVARLRLV
jgi:hypothetical protein